MTLIYVDTETGGLDPKNSTFQVALVTIDGSVFNSFIRSDEWSIQPDSLVYNQIDLRESKDWPTEDDVRQNLLHWMALNQLEAPFTGVGFNVRFDVERVNKLMRASIFSHRCLDLTSIALFHGIPCKSHELIERFGDPNLPAHDALNDALNSKMVHENMRSFLTTT